MKFFISLVLIIMCLIIINPRRSKDRNSSAYKNKKKSVHSSHMSENQSTDDENSIQRDSLKRQEENKQTDDDLENNIVESDITHTEKENEPSEYPNKRYQNNEEVWNYNDNTNSIEDSLQNTPINSEYYESRNEDGSIEHKQKNIEAVQAEPSILLEEYVQAANSLTSESTNKSSYYDGNKNMDMTLNNELSYNEISDASNNNMIIESNDKPSTDYDVNNRNVDNHSELNEDISKSENTDLKTSENIDNTIKNIDMIQENPTNPQTINERDSIGEKSRTKPKLNPDQIKKKEEQRKEIQRNEEQRKEEQRKEDQRKLEQEKEEQRKVEQKKEEQKKEEQRKVEQRREEQRKVEERKEEQRKEEQNERNETIEFPIGDNAISMFSEILGKNSQFGIYLDIFLTFIGKTHKSLLVYAPYPYDLIIFVIFGIYIAKILSFFSCRKKNICKKVDNSDLLLHTIEKKFKEISNSLMKSSLDGNKVSKTTLISEEDKKRIFNGLSSTEYSISAIQENLQKEMVSFKNTLNEICDTQINIIALH